MLITISILRPNQEEYSRPWYWRVDGRFRGVPSCRCHAEGRLWGNVPQSLAGSVGQVKSGGCPGVGKGGGGGVLDAGWTYR